MVDVVQAIQSAIEIVGRLRNLSKKIDEAEFRMLLADLSGDLADAKVEVAALKVEIARLTEQNQELAARLAQRASAKPTFSEGAYRFDGDDGHFCTACFDVRQQRVRLAFALCVAAGPILLDRFNQLAAMAYGWMPRIVRIDPHDTSRALAALVAAQRATPARLRRIAVADVAACLHSLVGASKVLHFVNDAVFPIWDSSIETFRLNGPPPYNHMNVAANYFAYAEEVHAIRLDPAFPAFLTQLTVAMNARLTALEIAHYPISEVRAIEAAAFELAP